MIPSKYKIFDDKSNNLSLIPYNLRNFVANNLKVTGGIFTRYYDNSIYLENTQLSFDEIKFLNSDGNDYKKL